MVGNTPGKESDLPNLRQHADTGIKEIYSRQCVVGEGVAGIGAFCGVLPPPHIFQAKQSCPSREGESVARSGVSLPGRGSEQY